MTNPTGPARRHRQDRDRHGQGKSPESNILSGRRLEHRVFALRTDSNGCDTSIGQGINIAVPVYVGGNLCMGQNATISKPVYVGGYLFFTNKQSSIGSNSSPVNSAHVGGYCQVQTGGTQVYPCKSEPVGGNNPNTNIWVTGAPTNLTGVASDFVGITAPKICWSGAASEVASGACTNTPPGGWYTFASPGPNNPCNTSTTGTVRPARAPTQPSTPATGS